MKSVLFLSAGSPCRAIMAKSILTKDLEVEKFLFDGAGLEGDYEVNDNALKIIQEEGIDPQSLEPKILSDVIDNSYDLVITICNHSKEICPTFPQPIPTIHLEFPVIDKEDEKTCRDFVAKVRKVAATVILKELS